MVRKTTAQKAVVAALSGMMALAPLAPVFAATDALSVNKQDAAYAKAKAKEDDSDFWTRLDGDDRYGTMDAILNEQYTFDWDGSAIIRDGVIQDSDGWYADVWSDGLTDAGTYYRVIDTAIVVSGENWADALTASALSGFFRTNVSDGTYYAPILITKSGALSAEAKDALKNMKVERVVILGGEASVSATVESQIKGLGLQDIDIIRIAGADRVETSVNAFYEMAKRNASDNMAYDVIIASGQTYADALSIGGIAAYSNVPIILTNADGELSQSAVQALHTSGVTRALIVGGTASVSSAVADQLTKQNISFDRIDGADRYETNWNILREAFNKGWLWTKDYEERTSLTGNLKKVVVASGEVYADALVGAPFAAEFEAPIVLVKDGASTLAYLEDNLNEDYKDFAQTDYILGGEASVSAAIADFLEDLDGVEARYIV